MEYFQNDPKITDQPDARTNNFGTDATFSISVNSSTAAFYQWRKDGLTLTNAGNISGSDTATLTVSGVSFADVGNYDVYVTNASGSTTSSVATLSVVDPIITSQPANTTNCAGQQVATFSAGASGSTNLLYQWRKNGTDLTNNANISGATAATLAINPVSATDAGTYRVTVASDASLQTNTSSSAVLTVIDPPTITSPPLSRTVQPGANVTFAVTATGTAPLSYKWFLDGSLIPGATASTFVVSNVVAGTQTISVTVTNETLPHVCNGASATATLTVTPGNIRLQETNLAVLRAGEGSQTLAGTGNSLFLDQFTTAGSYVSTVMLPESGTNPIVIQGNATTEGYLSRSLDGRLLSIAGYDTNLANTAGLGNSSVPRVVATINGLGAYNRPFRSTLAYTAQQFRAAASDGTNNFWGAAGANGTLLLTPPLTFTTIQSSKANTRSVQIFNGDVYLTTASASGTPAVQGLIKIPGLPTNSITLTASSAIISTNTGSGSGIGDVAVSPSGNIIYLTDDRAPNGIAGGIQRWNYDSANNIYTNAYNLTNGIGIEGTRHLTVDWSGTDPIIYATTTLGTQNKLIKVTDAGQNSPITVLATAGPNQNFKGVKFGPVADPATIALHPSSSTNCEGATVTFTATTAGTAPLFHQWQENGTNLVDGGNVFGANTPSLTLSNVTSADATSYTLTVTNDLATVTSDPVVLTLFIAPTNVVSDPQNVATNSGATVSFAATVGAGNFLTYQWRKDGTNLVNDDRVLGATTTNLIISSVNGNDTGSYDIIVSNSCGSATSAVSTLLVTCPTITISPGALPDATIRQPYNQTNIASGGTAPYNFTIISGALPAGLSLSTNGIFSGTPTAVGNFNFTMTATDANGCATNQAYALNVICPNIVLSPSTLPNGTEGSNYSQTISASGGFGSNSFAVTSGSLPNGLSLSSDGLLSGTLTTNGTFNFTVTATDGDSCTGNRAYKLNIGVAPPTIADQPQGSTNALGTTATFSVTATGAAPLSYQWMKDDVALNDVGNISGSTNATLTISSVALSNAGIYSVTVTNAGGSVTSSNATLVVVAPARFEAITRLPANDLRFTISGTANITYTLQAATALTNWSTVTNFSSTNGVFEYTETSVLGLPQKIFRVIWQP